nr:ABC transporter ATP-binding protein [uncultured Cellulosilyticum sp.]
MKKNLTILHWLLQQTRPVLFYLILIILLNSVTSVVGVASALVTKSLIDAATTHGPIFKWMGILGGILIFQIVARFVGSLLTTYCANKFSNTLQTKLYSHITYSEWQEQMVYHSANIISRLTGDLNTVTTLITSSIPSVISLGITLVTAFFTLLYLIPSMAIIAIILSPLTVIFASFFSKCVKKYYMALQDNNIKHRSFLQESLQNIVITKAFCEEQQNIEVLKSIQDKSFKLSMNQTKLSTCSTTFFHIGGVLGYFLIFAWGALNLAHQTGTYGTLTALMQLFSNVQAPFTSLARYYPQFVTSFAASERLMILEELHLETINKLNLGAAPTIEFKDVSFAYEPNRPVLNKVSCIFEPGEIIGLIGPSGEGKTTLIRLLLALVTPLSGEILINDGIHTSRLSASFRNFVSYVPQGNTLFSGTIASNLYKGNHQATPSDIMKALQLADIDEFVYSLEHQLETLIGEKGIGLSEGQAQRLAIARAFLRQKPILILDEATSALDPNTEIKVLKAVSKLEYHPTCIIITHRPSALNICDRIYALEKGCLIEKESIKKDYCINN